MRQMAETVFDKLHHAFRLDWERPHQQEGFQTQGGDCTGVLFFSRRPNRKS